MRTDGQSRRWEVAKWAPNPQETLIRTQHKELVQQLPVKYAQVVRLRYFNALHYEEIAAYWSCRWVR